MPEAPEVSCEVMGDRRVVIMNGKAVWAFEPSDVGMAHMAVEFLRSLDFSGQQVARVLGFSESYVATLHQRAAREGSAGLVRSSGRPGSLTEAQLDEALALSDQGVSNVEIGTRFGVHNSTISRALATRRKMAAAKPTWQRAELDLSAGVAPCQADETELADTDTAEAERVAAETVEVENVDAADEDAIDVTAVAEPTADPAVAEGGADPPAAGGAARIGVGSFPTRYAGATLLYPFLSLVQAEAILAAAALGAKPSRPRLRFDDLAVLTGACAAFGLGFRSVEQFKFPDRAEFGPVAGIDVMPDLRAIRPRLAQIADHCNPMQMQRSVAQEMLAVEPNVSGVYFVDEHFMPYSGAKPVGSGWNTKRRHAEPGRVDTHICDPKGRAVCFTSGEPSGLSKTLAGVLKELRKILGPDAQIMLGFDRGGAYAGVFKACRKQGAHWITYRRAPLDAPTGLPIVATITHPRREPTTIAYADETVTIKDYGQARQITLFEKGKPVLQILTSDTSTCPGALALFMRARWRIENLFKYLDFYGIDYIADYHATIEANTRKVDNPERKKLKAELKNLTAQRDQQRERIGAAHTNRNLTVNQINAQSTAAQHSIRALDKQIEELTDKLKTVPGKLPANLVKPGAQRAIHRAHRRGLQMALRLLAANAENWLAYHLNAYLQDNDEYRATARRLLELGGTIELPPIFWTPRVRWPGSVRKDAPLCPPLTPQSSASGRLTSPAPGTSRSPSSPRNSGFPSRVCATG
jgi:transposase